MLNKRTTKPVIIVLGGYGNFGKRICHELAALDSITLIIAGRHLDKAQALQNLLLEQYPKHDIQPVALDHTDTDLSEKLKQLNACILVHTAGPFQQQSYDVVRACIVAGVHYVDIADAREYVCNIGTFDADAKAHQIVVVSGASSVPGLSSAVIEHFALRYSNLLDIDLGISPANQVERGVGTLQSVLDYAGKPFLQLDNAQWKTVYGWQQLHRNYFGDNIGMRWQGACNVPDLDLLPKRFQHLRSAKFYAGLELGGLHLILWCMTWLVRWKLLPNLSMLSGILQKISLLFSRMGTTKGGMYIHLYGTDHEYQPLEIDWHLIAETAHGVQIPIIPALIIIRKILNNELFPGARPCMHLFDLSEFDEIAKKWNIYHTSEEKKM